MSGKRILTGTIVISAIVLWWLFGFRSAPETPPPSSPAAPSVSEPPSTVVVPANSAGTQPEATATATPPDAEPDPSLSGKERAEVATFATTFMKAFARPTTKVSARAWWERVAKNLTDDAVDLYAGITPDQVRFTKVTGAAQLQDVDTASDAFWIQPVAVPTDAGRYMVLVQLPASGFADRLLVMEIQEP